MVAIAVGIAAYVAATRDDTPSQPALVERQEPDPGEEELATPGVAEPGHPAPELSATGLDGEPVALADFRGRPVVVNFWASWCYPCRQEFPLLREVHAEGDVAVIGVVYRDIPSDAEAFVQDLDATWPQALDPDRAIAEAYGVRSIPRTFFIDASGTIVASAYGFTEESFRRHVENLD